MRNFQNLDQAYSEIRRDLKAFGVVHNTRTMQNKSIVDDDNFSTLELTNYGYVIQSLDFDGPVDHIPGFHDAYARSEWHDRLVGIDDGFKLNPGNSWAERPEVWGQFLTPKGKFDYTYAERLTSFRSILTTLEADFGTRRAWYPIFDESDVHKAFLPIRVPCSIGYNFQIRDNKLHITYIMRSCDFYTHWAIDVYLAYRLLGYVSRRIRVESGTFTHFIMSLHVYKKDIGEVF